MGDIKVSFIIPCYNAQTYIHRCITSIYSTVPYEIIVVNDGSLDDTRQVIERLQQNHQEIRLLNKENEGVNAARRDGWRMAKGEYVCFVDADDTVEWTDELLQFFYSDADIIKTAGYYVTSCGLELYKNVYEGRVDGMEQAYKLMINGQILPFVHTAFYRNSIIDEECFDIPCRFSIGEDLLFNLNVMSKVGKMVCLPIPFYRYLMNEASVMHTKVWGFNYIRDFNAMLSSIVLRRVPTLERQIVKHRFFDYVGTLLFPEVEFKKEYYQEIRSMIVQYPWLLKEAPRRLVFGIKNEYTYHLYLWVYRSYQKMKGRGRRGVLD